MTITIERASLADTDDLVRAQIASFHHDAKIYPGIEIGGPPGYDSVAHMAERVVQDECYKIADGSRIIGGIVVFAKGDAHYHLDVIFVEPGHQNRGIGSLAIQYIEAAYLARVWTLDTPQWAVRNHHFYEKLGYVRVGEHEDGDTPLFAYEKQMDGAS
jgi:GNAT superfamily N-acetyltransferase